MLASATIANPLELAEGLVGEPFRLVDSDGAPRAAAPNRDVEPAGHRPAIDDPPVGSLGGRGAPGRPGGRGDADDLLPSQPARHRADPALHPHAARGAGPRRSSPSGSPPTGPATRPSSDARSRRAWPAGDLLAVVATDALELGIDIGYLDAAICVTFPGTVASLRQMWGRAGRRSEGLALYIAGEDALDQFFCRHPDEFLERPVEAAILDHENDRIQLAHMLAAAYEIPLIGVR